MDVIVVVAEEGDVMVAEPALPTKDHNPVPIDGTAAIVIVVVLQSVWSAPAAATGCASICQLISAGLDVVHALPSAVLYVLTATDVCPEVARLAPLV